MKDDADTGRVVGILRVPCDRVQSAYGICALSRWHTECAYDWCVCAKLSQGERAKTNTSPCDNLAQTQHSSAGHSGSPL